MQIEIKNGNLIIAIPLQTPQVSSTGKTMVVATTHGFTATTAAVEGKPVKVNITAIIPR